MNRVRRHFYNKEGSMTMYVIIVLASVLVAVSILMAIVIRNSNAVKVKDKLTYEESMAVNNIKRTFDEYSGLSVKDKTVEEIEYDGQKFTLEIIPTQELTKKKVEKEYKFTNSKVNAERYYAYDTIYTAQESKVNKQDVYNTVSTFSQIDASNNTNNQYLVFGNDTYQKTTVSALPTTLKGLINNTTTTTNKFPDNYLDVTRGAILPVTGAVRVRVTKDNNEYTYVDNYPSNLNFPYSIAERAIFLVEYLDKNNKLVKWSRFGPTVNPNSPLQNVFANKSFFTDNNDRRDRSLANSDILVTSIKNTNLYREMPKVYGSLSETLASLQATHHTTNSSEDYKTTGVSMNYVWDYIYACVSEEVIGYPFTGELQTTKEKRLTEYLNSNCTNNQPKVTYDVSLSKGRDAKESYPLYTNWSTLDTSKVEEIFDYYKKFWQGGTAGESNYLFMCIRNYGATHNHFCKTQAEASNQSIYKGAYSRQNIKENFLFCSMDGYKTTVVDSNERWTRFSNKMYDEIIQKMEARVDALEREAYAKAMAEYAEALAAIAAFEGEGDPPEPPDPPSNPLSINRVGQPPTRPDLTYSIDGIDYNSLKSNKRLLAYYMPKYMAGDGYSTGEIISSSWTDVSINIPKVIEIIVEEGNYKQKFQTELNRADFYKVPCLPSLNKNNTNFKFTVDEVPYTVFNLDIITNIETPVKVTTKHYAEIDNARTEYILNFYNGTDLVNLYKEQKRNSKEPQYKTFNETKKVDVKPNYTSLDFADMGRDIELVNNRLQFQFSSFNRNLEYVKVEYDVIETMKYEYHIYNSRGERLYYTTAIKKNSL